MSMAAPGLFFLLLLSAGSTSTSSSSSRCTAAVAAASPAPTATIPEEHHSNSSKPASLLLQSTCNSTTYYDLCLAALAADPSSATADVRGLCAIALSAAAANASATASALAYAASPTSSRSLLQTCAVKYGDAREALLAARESILLERKEDSYDYAFVHVGAAAEYPAVCRTLFRRQRRAYPRELATREEGLEHLCAIAIDIISLLAST